MAISVDCMKHHSFCNMICETLPSTVEYLTVRALVKLIQMFGTKARPTDGVPLYSAGFEVVKVSRFS